MYQITLARNSCAFRKGERGRRAVGSRENPRNCTKDHESVACVFRGGLMERWRREVYDFGGGGNNCAGGV